MTGLYRLQELKKDYLVGKVIVHALRNLSFDIKHKEFVALLGPSGSGKSTLLNTLGLIEPPTEGKLFFADKNICEMPEHELTKIRRKSVGFIFQNFNLLPILSAIENVEYPIYLNQENTLKEIRSMSMEILNTVGLEEYIHHKPSELSGGQRQRVAIARALIKNPDVIIADEPTANLDSKTAGQIMELICEMQEKFGTTVILATHDLNTAGFARRKIIIKDGMVFSDKDC